MSRLRPKAMALANALLVATILLVLGLVFLTYLERDYKFAGTQERSQEAYYLALAGLQYSKTRPDLIFLGCPPVTRAVPAGDSFHTFELRVDAAGSLSSRGVVRSGILIVAERTLVVPPGRGVSEHVDQSL